MVYNHKQMGEIQKHTREQLNNIPRPVAEYVQPELASAAVRLYETKTLPAGLFRSAWHHVEYGLNRDMHNKAEVTEMFSSSQQLVSMILKHPEAHQDMKLGALTLSTYVPLFRKRAEGESVLPQDCEDVYKSLGAAMAYLKPLGVNEPPQWRMTEVGVLALSARTRQPWLLLYPTSPREEMSVDQSLNHDSYFFEEDSKIPLQQKLLPTQKTYDECITILTLQPLMDKALKIAGEKTVTTLSEKVNYLLSLIIAETSGEQLGRDEARFLNCMSEAVAAHHYRLSGNGGVLREDAASIQGLAA